MSEKNYVIGLDYGTDSVRSVIVDAATGEEIASAVKYYPQWMEGKYCDAPKNQFRQHPQDYIDGLVTTIKESLAKCSEGTAQLVKGIAVDTTGSTPVAVDKEGTPLSLKPEFAENPNAMFVLWKDHTAVKEADEINQLSRSWGGTDFTCYEGGIYSSEWFWAKILHVIREDKAVADAAYSWVEHCDWIPALLTGTKNIAEIKRSRCAAGHKAMWHPDFDGLPDKEFLTKLDPRLAELRDRLFDETFTSDVPFGKLTQEWADKLGLSTDVVVGVGAFDAHMGAVGGEIKPYYLSKVIGTSTCDMLTSPSVEMGDKLVNGICGQVDGSIVPGMLGMEAGQSAFGDIYAWFKKVLMWPVENLLEASTLLDENTKDSLVSEISDNIIPLLSEKASNLDPADTSELALDWMNGRRTPDANQLLKGAIVGLNLGSDAPRIFRALVESTAFGAKKIVDRFLNEGVRIDGVIALGGVAKKSPFVMQVLADVLNMKILVAKSEQTCALGAAMFAATAAGLYKTVDDAQKAMGSGYETEFSPNAVNVEKYKSAYENYSKLGEFIENELTK